MEIIWLAALWWWQYSRKGLVLDSNKWEVTEVYYKGKTVARFIISGISSWNYCLDVNEIINVNGGPWRKARWYHSFSPVTLIFQGYYLTKLRLVLFVFLSTNRKSVPAETCFVWWISGYKGVCKGVCCYVALPVGWGEQSLVFLHLYSKLCVKSCAIKVINWTIC